VALERKDSKDSELDLRVDFMGLGGLEILLT
jgi:hypothetical protein